MKSVLLVFLGGGLGSVVRYLLGGWISLPNRNPFPLGTLIVNIIACLILGFIVGLADHKQAISSSSRLFWVIGFCGGFSTFSTFSNETLFLMQNGFTISLLLYIALSLSLCVLAIATGIYLSTLL
jgi:fluoride exporter